MPIPKEILAVKRPVNTVVIVYGKNKDRYAVRQRVGCKNINGRHVPVNGPTIGHIINGEYVPIGEKPSASTRSVDIKDWANVQLCEHLFHDVFLELNEVYSLHDALALYCIAILRACNHSITDYELKEAYENSFLSELYPGVALSKNMVSMFLSDIGKAYSLILKFMRMRAQRVNLGHHLLVDGTLKTDDSTVNSLSDFSHKAHIKGTRDISIIFAFDLEAQELICSQCYPGNMLDLTAYSSFITDHHLCKGLIVADKGFPSSAAEKTFEENKDLHYLNPIKRNSKLIDTHRLMELTAQLKDHPCVTYKTAKCHGKNKWLYAFRDAELAAMEESAWLEQSAKKDSYDLDTLKHKRKSFGTVVLESDLEMAPEVAYQAYSQRWEIEIVMRYYKHACGFTTTCVQSDYSVYGSEFCDFLATMLTFRLIKAFDKAGLFEEMTYKKIMATLCRAKKYRLEGGDWNLIKINPSQEDLLVKLGLLPRPQEPLKRKPGRPRKNPL